MQPWLQDFLIQLPNAPSWRGPIAEFIESVRESYDTSPHLAHREFSALIDGLLVAHLLELDISAEDFDGLSHEIVHNTDSRLGSLRQFLEAGGDFDAFAAFMTAERAALPPKLPGTPRSSISLVTSVALDPLAHAPASPKPEDQPRRTVSVPDLPAIPETKAGSFGVVVPDAKKTLTEDELSHRLERLQNLKLHIAKRRPGAPVASLASAETASISKEETASSKKPTADAADQARQNLTLTLLQDLRK